MRNKSEATKQKDRERAKAWNAANKERHLANVKRWHEQNPDKVRASARRHYATKKDDCLASLRLFYAKNPWYRHWQSAKQRCNNPKASSYEYYGGRGIRCLLTQEEIAFLWFRDKAAKLRRPSLDKIDSDMDYTVANCRFIELSENCSKGKRDQITRARRGLTPTATHKVQ